uniref:Putative ovule protein n=1 Tax=Solanum chacoense TaxID=4108 RepID=A0A0V0IA22_SOLCH
MLYSRCFDDPHICRDPVPGRVLLSCFKMGYNCKAVLSGWLVKSVVYFTNRKGGRGCLFQWSFDHWWTHTLQQPEQINYNARTLFI